ncbi:LacI family DNA-binding transcriptional regulator [Dactylosporangium darangshiense]|uniref:LacI family DNA-binding transcriptional regulator n=1 Tax=Dactylosporangium darangshiense TaxID=579108 RepID=A0ABP8DLG1_9ACTN
MPRRATIRDLADETGVSVATVSRVLNGHANVSAQTRDLVLRAASKLGRHGPRSSSGSAAGGDTVFVRCPYVLSDYFGLIVSSIVETVELHGMSVMLNAGKSAVGRSPLPTLPERAGVRGAILILPPEPAEDLAALRDRRFPFVVVDPRTAPPRDVVAVSSAHFAGARSVSAHVVGLGHRRVGIIGGPREWSVNDGRLAGYIAPLVDVGVLPPAELMRFVTEPNEEQGHAAACELLDLPEPPTALLAFNDKIAVGALRAAAERGLRVPDDLSVAGFDDIEVSRATRPMLTTVRQPLAELGRMAVTMLLRMMGGHELDALHVELATELVVRDSTAPPRPL